jgi:DNA invertase Pin-like site-specific DNA recombinase
MKHSPDTRSLNRTETRTPRRPQLQAELNALVEGDELVVTALSRLGRDQRSAINRLHDLQVKGLHVRTLVERKLKRERTLENVQHRRETGESVGERPKTDKATEGLVLRLHEEGCSYRSIRRQSGLALSTIRRIICDAEMMV